MPSRFKKAIKNFFSFKKSSANQGTGPDFVELPKEQTPPAALEVNQESFQKIEKSLFTDKDSLRQAIKLGVKISQHQQNRVISQFKRTVKSWEKACDSLKTKDFTDKSKNLEALVANINKGSRNYKKTSYTFRDGFFQLINKKGRTYLEKTAVLRDLYNKFKDLDEEQLKFLDNYPIPNEISKIKEIHAACNELNQESEQEIMSNWDANYSECKITFAKFAGLIDILSSLTPEQLKTASEICYHSTNHYWIILRLPAGELPAGEDAFGWGPEYKQYFQTPLDRIYFNFRYYNQKGNEQALSKKKFTLDTFKVKYMEAMHTAAENSLQALKGGK